MFIGLRGSGNLQTLDVLKEPKIADAAFIGILQFVLVLQRECHGYAAGGAGWQKQRMGGLEEQLQMWERPEREMCVHKEAGLFPQACDNSWKACRTGSSEQFTTEYSNT